MAKPDRHRTYLLVTTRAIYMYTTGMDGRTDDSIRKEWFEQYPIDSYHATRDSMRIGGSGRFVDAQLLPEDDLAHVLERNPIKSGRDAIYRVLLGHLAVGLLTLPELVNAARNGCGADFTEIDVVAALHHLELIGLVSVDESDKKLGRMWQMHSGLSDGIEKSFG